MKVWKFTKLHFSTGTPANKGTYIGRPPTQTDYEIRLPVSHISMLHHMRGYIQQGSNDLAILYARQKVSIYIYLPFYHSRTSIFSRCSWAYLTPNSQLLYMQMHLFARGGNTKRLHPTVGWKLGDVQNSCVESQKDVVAV